jgi:hypothetical protein
MCSARSTEKISRWRKNSAAHFRSCFCWRLQRFLTQNMAIKFVKGIHYLPVYKLYKILGKIHTSKSSAPFLPFLGKSAEYSAADFLGRSYFYGATFAFCGRNFGRLGTLKREGFWCASTMRQSNAMDNQSSICITFITINDFFTGWI